MNILLLNGSPRKGNTFSALEKLKQGLQNIKDLQINQIDTSKVSVSPCIACEKCKQHHKCIFNDDTNSVIDAIVDADAVIFATPVYWWGITSQLKLIIDKFYSRQEQLSAHKKQIGIISIGQLSTDNIQYKLISDQLQCISDYLGWEIVFCHSYSAYDKGDLLSDKNALQEIENLWRKIK